MWFVTFVYVFSNHSSISINEARNIYDLLNCTHKYNINYIIYIYIYIYIYITIYCNLNTFGNKYVFIKYNNGKYRYICLYIYI